MAAETPKFQEGTSHVELPDGNFVPSAEQWNRRAVQIDKEMHRLRLQMAFLFAFLLACMILVTVYQQIQNNQIEYNRYDLCQERAAGIRQYNTLIPPPIPPFPQVNCGVDPRTD